MEDWNQSDSDSDNEYGESDSLSVKFTKTSFLLVVLDTVESMFVVGKDNLSPFQMTIRSCLNIAERLLLTLTENSRIAIILNGKPDFTNFKTSVCGLVKLLLDMNAQSNEDLKKKYMSSSRLNVADMLLSGKRIYKDVKTAGIRNLVFLTNDDCPTGKDAKAKEAAKYEAQNIGNNIIFDIVTFSPDFEFEEFYGDLLKAAKRPVVYEFCPDLELLENKLSFYCIYIHHESTLKFYPLDDSETIIPLIKSRCIRRNRDILSNVKLTLDHSEEVTREVERTVSDEYHPEGDALFIISAAEVDELRNQDIPIGLHLVSMAPATEWMAPSSIPDVVYCRDPVGQEKLEPFWDHCRETGEVLLCVLMKQRNKLGRHCELHPINVDKTKCFMIHPLTYSHDRNHDDHFERYGASNEAKDPTAAEEKAAEDLINAMTIEYDRDNFQCPSASRMREYLRSELLDVPTRPIVDVDVRTRQYVTDEAAVRSAAATFTALLIDPYVIVKERTKRAKAEPKEKKEKAPKAAPKKRARKDEEPIVHVQ